MAVACAWPQARTSGQVAVHHLAGVKGDDLRAYLAALKKIGYKGGLSIECFVYNDFEKEAKRGVEVLKQQLSEV